MEKIHPAIFVYILIVAVYSAIFLVSPLLGPTDDFVFLKTLQINKSLFTIRQIFPTTTRWQLDASRLFQIWNITP